METWLELIQHYGYIASYLILTLGIIGLPVPDEVILTYLGYVTSLGKMNFFITFLTTFAGALSGISLSYLLGHKLGEPFLRKYGPKFFIKEKTIRRTNDLFRKYGSFVLFICYFIPGIRHVAAYLAGITSFSFKRFTLYAYSGAFIWILTFLTLGNRLGENWPSIFHFLQRHMLYIMLLFLLSIVILLIKMRLRIKKT